MHRLAARAVLSRQYNPNSDCSIALACDESMPHAITSITQSITQSITCAARAAPFAASAALLLSAHSDDTPKRRQCVPASRVLLSPLPGIRPGPGAPGLPNRGCGNTHGKEKIEPLSYNLRKGISRNVVYNVRILSRKCLQHTRRLQKLRPKWPEPKRIRPLHTT